MNVAFIPVGGGEKSIHFENLKLIAGKPLVYWSIKAACDCEYIDQVFVSTNSENIRLTVEKMCLDKLTVVGLPEGAFAETSSPESEMLEFAKKHDFETIFLIQSTSPLLTADDLDEGFRLYMSEKTDSVLSTVRQKRFCWKQLDDGCVLPINYDYLARPRRQEFGGYLVENGAFYITSREALLSSKNRISGKIKAYEMPEESYFEIDEPSDWIIVEGLLKKQEQCYENKVTDKKLIKMVLTDCDGCLTDGGMYYSETGDELKKFNAKDGMGFGMLRESGILTGIVTGENVNINKKRATKLKVDVLIEGCKNKLEAVTNLCSEHGIALESVAYIGDDINDIELIKKVGISFAPADAVKAVRGVADYVTIAKGGEGVFREAAETVLMRNSSMDKGSLNI